MPSLIQSAFTLLPCLPVSSKQQSFPLVFCICIYSFTYSLILYFLWIISFILLVLLYHPLHYLLITWNLFVTLVIQRAAAHPITPPPPNLTWFIIPLIESDQKPIESQSNICISPSSVWFNCQCCQSRLCRYLPEPCHSSLPCNLVSRFTV